MLVYFSKDGSLKEIVSSYRLNAKGAPSFVASFSSFRANEGNRAWNDIFVHFEGGLPDPFSRPTVSYALPDGTTFSPADTQSLAKESLRILPDDKRDLRFFKELEWYDFYRFPIPTGLFTQGGDGRYLAMFRQHVSAEETASFDIVSFRVDRGVTVEESFINETQYEYLNALVHSFDGRVAKTEEKTKWQTTDDLGTSFQGELRACTGIVKTNAIGSCAPASESSLRLSKEETVFDKPARIEEIRGSDGGGVSVRDSKGEKEILRVKDGETAFLQSFIAPSVKLAKEASEPNEAVSKGYVDAEFDKVSADRLGLKNGEAPGSIVMKNEGNSATGKGVGSFVGGTNCSSGAPHSFLWGKNLSAEGFTSRFVIGNYNDSNDSSSLFSVGCGTSESSREDAFSIFANGTSFFWKNAIFSSEAQFNNGVLVNGDLIVKGKTVTTDIENVSTSRKTIGLALGNVAPISGYAGMYATKYDGVNYGALAWDKDGVAYVGDCAVDESGEIFDLPSNGLQPLLTRAKESELSDGDVLTWDAKGKKAKGRKVDFGEFASVSSENVFLAKNSFPMGLQIGNTNVSGGSALNVSLPSENGEIATTGNSTQVIIRRW